ncbi:hypothetical protein ROP_pROB01-03720 (plasmid) [Rhodococcus opacus B4]|uniref:Uncharacterized protein n=1 Tax=Rhodococcus opacus (strain B4) TaxID=632772 RepID=C1BDC7_RHOOB|nr:hypothetical protein ROP_pROB01-03720 [Rhodococcus opacus B4]
MRTRPPCVRHRLLGASDGPILTGVLAEATETGGLPDSVQRWLASTRWHTGPALLCPDHT